MVDRWVHGHLAECQDGCPKFVQEVEVTETPGGAANAANCLTHWDVNVALYGFALNDCPVKSRCVEGEKIVFRADNDGPETRGTKYGWSRDMALEMLPHASAVLLSDYDKGFLTPEFIREVAKRCRARDIPCVADVKRRPEVYDGCLKKGNAVWARGYGKPDITTRGACLPVVLMDGVVGDDLPPVKCVNHVGAGDCFTAHLVLALAYGFHLKEAAGIAHSAGRVYVQHPRNRPPTPAEIAADMALATE